MSVNERKRAARANAGVGWSMNWTRERSLIVGGPAGHMSTVPVACAAGRCVHAAHPPSHSWQVLATVPAGTDVYGAFAAVARVWRVA